MAQPLPFPEFVLEDIIDVLTGDPLSTALGRPFDPSEPEAKELVRQVIIRLERLIEE